MMTVTIRAIRDIRGISAVDIAAAEGSRGALLTTRHSLIDRWKFFVNRLDYPVEDRG